MTWELVSPRIVRRLVQHHKAFPLIVFELGDVNVLCVACEPVVDRGVTRLADRIIGI